MKDFSRNLRRTPRATFDRTAEGINEFIYEPFTELPVIWLEELLGKSSTEMLEKSFQKFRKNPLNEFKEKSTEECLQQSLKKSQK